MPTIDQHILDQIQPVVLVGGRSSRFGRDKLVESVGGAPMVASPISALRSVFGDRVAAVGACDPTVAELADFVIEDPYPGLGPAGGICAALEHARCDVLVCAGDLVAIDAGTICAIIKASIDELETDAYLAWTDRLHPTIGLYRARCVDRFRSCIKERKLKLGMVLWDECVCRVPVDVRAVRNVNRPDELDQ